ncbi:NADH:ubiquinone oxidoreductase subunit 6 (subunit J) [Bosea sp. OAE752]|uniref:hypothetical protein n=1 Tax=Bosea sp. OAE752 TaxID=2663873 RepID=UPI003D1901BE
MADFAGAEILKPFPLLQLAGGVVVIILAIFMTLRGAKDNKKDGHLAPQGHDPFGLVVLANSILAQVSIIAEGVRRMAARMDDLHDEQIKTNARLGEMTDRHAREMDSLRDTIERVERKPRPGRRN